MRTVISNMFFMMPGIVNPKVDAEEWAGTLEEVLKARDLTDTAEKLFADRDKLEGMHAKDYELKQRRESLNKQMEELNEAEGKQADAWVPYKSFAHSLITTR